MAKKRKKLTSADENLDPDVPTELELRLEEELRLAYEAERLIEEGGGFKDLAAKHDETLTLIDRGFDKVENIRIGEEVELEKVLEQLTKEELVVIVKEALGKDKELEKSVKKRFGFVVFKRIDNDDDLKALEKKQKQKQKKVVSRGQAVGNAGKRHLDKGQDQLLVSSGRDRRVVANVEKRYLEKAQDELRVSSRRNGHVVANVEKMHLDETQDQERFSSRRDRRVVANVERRHLDEAQDQEWFSSRRDRHVVANVERRHLDEAQDQLQVASKRDGRYAANVEKRQLDEAQDQKQVASRRDRRYASNVEKRQLDEAQDQKQVASRRDGLYAANVEKRHLNEAQNQLRLSFKRDEKPEFFQSRRQKGKREELAMPEVGAFGTTCAYLTSYGDYEQLHHLSWSDNYQNKYSQSGYWQGQHRFGVNAYDLTLTGARTLNPGFGQASSEVISRRVADDYWPNSFQDGTRAAQINPPESLHSYNPRYENIHDPYWRQNSQYMQPHSIYEEDRHHMWPIPK